MLFELVMETIKHTYPWVSWERLNLDAPLRTGVSREKYLRPCELLSMF